MVVFKGPEELWEAAKVIKDGAQMKVKYDSTRSSGIKEMKGRVTEVDAHKGYLMIKMVRDDGQTVEVSSDGACYSVGSHFPKNGDVWSIRVFNDGDQYGRMFMMGA